MKKLLRENPVLLGFAASALGTLAADHGLQLEGWDLTGVVLLIAGIAGWIVRALVVPLNKLRKVDANPGVALVDGPRPYEAVRAGDRVMVSEVVDALQETYSTSRWLTDDETPSVIGALAGDSYGSGRVLIIDRRSTGEIFRAP